MSARIRRILGAEVTKALHRKSTYAGPLLVVLAVPCLLPVRPVGGDAVSAYAFVAYATPVALNLIGTLVLTMYCAGLVASEVGRGTICLMLVRPMLRRDVILAKALFGVLYAAVLVLLVSASTWGLAYAFGSPEGVTYGGEVLSTHIELAESYAIGALLVLLPLSAAAAYGVMWSSLTRSGGAAMAGAVLSSVVADLIKYPLHAAPYVYTTYLETPWRVFAAHCDGLDASWGADAAYCAVCSVASFVVFVTVAVVALGRRDIQA